MRNARGAEVSTKPLSLMKVFTAAGVAEAETGASFPGSRSECEIRPTCHSWITILPPRACTAEVTAFQPSTCAGV